MVCLGFFNCFGLDLSSGPHDCRGESKKGFFSREAELNLVLQSKCQYKHVHVTQFKFLSLLDFTDCKEKGAI